MAVDAQVRCSWTMLGREPRSRDRTADGLRRHLGARRVHVGGRYRTHDVPTLGSQCTSGDVLCRCRTSLADAYTAVLAYTQHIVTAG